MMLPTIAARRQTDRRQWIGAGVLLGGCAATVGIALLFEHVGGYIPCALCLQERQPYYASVAIALLALVAVARGAPVRVTRGLLLLIGLAMLWSLGLAVYHSGVEWHFWAGPSGCASAGGADLGGDLLATIDHIKPPACDQAAGRFLGISFAGWNVLASALWASVALFAGVSKTAPTERRRPHSGSSSLSQ